ncbi:glutathione S-transferase [Purpureocillium lavendulum]|uniref:Glutathione S-transferase n=1 Tax=Purpureocillium lavendulum TaxID=1247861 RepID=A0AB34FSQ3_9HYPO|nr:glutathione S-transferase [Purpureocillium lavendulum]
MASRRILARANSNPKPWEVNEDLSAGPPKARAKQREPPPVLFLHPSPGASHVSLPGALAPGAPLPGPASTRRDQPSLERSASVRSGSGPQTDIQQRPGRALLTATSTRSTDRTDALWAEMQATLEEVELSASGGTHVFGPEHDHKLSELRTAQIALAQAWARSEADDAIEATLGGTAGPASGEDLRNIMGNLSEAPRAGAGDGTDAAKSTAGTTSGQPESSNGGADLLGAKLEEETEVDILLARKRREANDQYFQRVNQGVIDVVAKLEDVAVAMRAVEQESKDVWHESGSGH